MLKLSGAWQAAKDLRDSQNPLTGKLDLSVRVAKPAGAEGVISFIFSCFVS
ncbi:hypothetical protein STRDD11_01789 [Streptococcus sp. DD11]|nr:hypothetical protein STRDD11_01789 [Streptococcus sp. DD11]